MLVAMVERGEGFGEFVARRAHAASDVALAGWAAVGGATLIAATVLRPRGWVFVGSLAALALAFGGWGIAERELADPRVAASRPTAIAFRILRALAVLLAFVAAIALVFAVPMLGIGTVIS